MSSDIPVNVGEKAASFPSAPNHTLYSAILVIHTLVHSLHFQTLTHITILLRAFHWYSIVQSLPPGPDLDVQPYF